MNGIRLLSATSNPAVMYLCVEYPETYNNPICGASFDDGIYIGDFGAETLLSENGTARRMEAYAGLSESETRSVVWRLFDKNGSQETEAVFVIDFAIGTVRLGSEEDLKEPPVGDYACGVEAIQNLQDGYIVEIYHTEQSRTWLYLTNGSEKREELWIEVWQDETLLDSQNIRRDYNGWSDNFLYQEYPDFDRVPGTEHTVCTITLQNSYVGLDLNRPLTVRAYNADGELVLDQEITLEISQG